MSDYVEHPSIRPERFRAVIDTAAEFVALQNNVSEHTARRLIRDRGLETGRFIGAVARDIITGRMRISDS